MTPEEIHNHNRQWALSPISYEAVCTDDAVIAFRVWLTKILERAYEAGNEYCVSMEEILGLISEGNK